MEEEFDGFDTQAPPIRLCCGQRHAGALCPDGRVMCCLCFERVSVDNLAVGDDGSKENVCIDCRLAELAKSP